MAGKLSRLLSDTVHCKQATAICRAVACNMLLAYEELSNSPAGPARKLSISTAAPLASPAKPSWLLGLAGQAEPG